MKKLDLSFIRSQFPSLQHPDLKDWCFFENAAASFVAQPVLKRMHDHMISLRVQPYARYSSSIHAGKAVDDSYDVFADLINADRGEIIFNASTSMNIYVLSNALRHELKRGDEIIVTNQDHESNIGFWRRMAAETHGVVVLEWSVCSKTGKLSIEQLEKLLSKNTKLVCLSHCSNVVGDVNDVKRIATLVHAAGGRVIVDGVSHLPHAMIDVKDLDVDFYVYSLYKTYGPHLGLLYAKTEHLESLANEGHYFNSHIFRKKMSPAGPQYAEIAYAFGIIDYYLAAHCHHFGKSDHQSLNEKARELHDLFHQSEVELCTPILRYLSSKKNVRIIGDTQMLFGKRSPNISFTVDGRTSKEMVDALTARQIAANNYHFYAKRLIEALGIIHPDDGAVRFSLLHYNSPDEVNRLLNALDFII